MREPWVNTDVNSKGVINLLEALRRFNPRAKLVHLGTTTQLGKLRATPANEDHPEFPTDIYSASKSVSEKYALIYGRAYGIPVTVVRLPNVYGPRAAIHSPDFTFNNFAVSSSNQLAFVSSQKVAENIGKAYNPLFIYGPVGVGKTHLMHAIANTVYQRDPAKKIIYITSEEFTNEVVESIRNNDTHRMKKKFRSAYVLVIDDIQFIEGKEKVQEELFHTFNILIDNGSQICLTSDRPPHEIKKLEARLSSRFAGGLTVDIGKPDLELKTAIIKKKAEKFGTELPIEVALFLAEQAEDTRSLEGLLIRVFTQLGQHEPTLEFVQGLVGHVNAEKKVTLHADDVINEVCSHFNVKATQLKGPKRDAFLVTARQVCMYILNIELKLTTVEVGNLLGGRDHTTIMHGVDKIRKLVDNKAPVTGDILGITQALRG
jgi:chromosomal replication initiator protein